MNQKFKKLSLLAVLLWLICSGNTLNWQGTGNLSQGNLSVIWTYIGNNFNTSWDYQEYAPTGVKLFNFASGLSTELNNQWAPSWNVILVITVYAGPSDVVVYGYAFRNHWMWYNGMPMIGDYYCSFIIWKDYNCPKWVSFNQMTQTSQTWTYTGPKYGAIYNMFINKQSSVSKSDIWSAAKLYA